MRKDEMQNWSSVYLLQTIHTTCLTVRLYTLHKNSSCGLDFIIKIRLSKSKYVSSKEVSNRSLNSIPVDGYSLPADSQL